MPSKMEVATRMRDSIVGVGQTARGLQFGADLSNDLQVRLKHLNETIRIATDQADMILDEMDRQNL